MIIPNRKRDRLDWETFSSLIQGENTINVKTWEDCTTYQGSLSAQSKEVKWFWGYLHRCAHALAASTAIEGSQAEDAAQFGASKAEAQELGASLKRIFKWATGWGTLPKGASSNLHFTMKFKDQTDALPSVYTCAKEIGLPHYSSKQKLIDCLVRASYEESFEMG